MAGHLGAEREPVPRGLAWPRFNPRPDPRRLPGRPSPDGGQYPVRVAVGRVRVAVPPYLG